jgi:hypothetical protein
MLQAVVHVIDGLLIPPLSVIGPLLQPAPATLDTAPAAGA